jgi:SsrA-binding protein
MPTRIINKKARVDYEITETFVAGVELLGPEVKSIRIGKASLKEAYARVIKGEVWLIGMHITPYDHSGYTEINPVRKRKLLLHKLEIRKIAKKTEEAGYTLVPIELFFSEKNIAKILIGLGKGRTRYDKKHYLIEKQIDLETRREVKERFNQ